MTFSSEKIRKPQFIFLVYMVVSSLFIMIFRFIFPGSEAPLIIFARDWRVLQGVLEVFNFFPALALSALVIPFGLASFEENYQSFSDIFFKRLISSIITAIIAAILYAIIFFFALPMLKNHEENLRYSGELYHYAKKNAFERRDAGYWFDAYQFIGICDHIWVNSPELAALRDEVVINMGNMLATTSGEGSYARARERNPSEPMPLSVEQYPVDSTQALSLSRIAFDEERYFDAHWLANLGMRLAIRGSAEAANAARLASEAWNKISSQAPNQRETHLFELFEMKLSGYRAMESGDWIQAFYIFKELSTLTPADPDIRNFLRASEIGARETAFFIDEIEMSLGEILNSVVFSLPVQNGRAVMRFSSITTSLDIAYGMGFEYMEFDENSNLRANVTSRYAKLKPVIIGGRPQIVILTHALNRYDRNHYYQSEWLFGNRSVSAGIFLDISFEDFVLVNNVRRGLTNLQIDELFDASNRLRDAGYVHQIFQAEVLNRLGSALFFLPVAIFVIIVAWRYRAKQKPRYFFALLLPVLPIVFHGFVFLYRLMFNTLGIWLVLSIGFSAALVVYIVTLAVTLFVSLIALSAQHS
jgi:hypothetical protein